MYGQYGFDGPVKAVVQPAYIEDHQKTQDAGMIQGQCLANTTNAGKQIFNVGLIPRYFWSEII